MEILARIFGALMLVIRWLFAPIYECKSYGQRKKLPPIKDPLLLLSATSLAKKIRRREITSVEVVTSFVKRCKEVNPMINAIIDEKYHEALEEARRVDELLERNDVDLEDVKAKTPLLGVPMSVKESCRVKGMSLTSGALYRKGVVSEEDSTIVSRLKSSGAIIFVVTNTPEFCLSAESSNNLHGVSRNPYDTSRTCGGSSGGEGAILGAAGSIIGIGSDLAGSVRVPAAFNGIFGLKPTPRVVPFDGHYPKNKDEAALDYATFGPLTRYAEDLPLLMKIISGEAGESLKLDEEIDLKNLKVYTVEELSGWNFPRVEEEIKVSVRKAATYLGERCKSDISDYKFDFEEVFEICAAVIFSIKNIPTPWREKPEKEKWFWAELAKAAFGKSEYTFNSLFFMLAAGGNGGIPKSKIGHYKKSAQVLKKAMQEKLGDSGVLIMPTMPMAAVYHNQGALIMMTIAYTLLANVLGLVSLNVPMGLNRKGLPIGIQVIASPYQEKLCIAVAKELEKGFGGWRPS